jgi:hypothetical protein
MKATKPKGYDQPLHWQAEFIKPAIQKGLVSESVIFELLDALHGPAPVVVEPLQQVVTFPGDFRMRIEYGSVWGDHSGITIELVWYVNQVWIDGSPISLKQLQKHDNWWSESYSGTLTAGDHELTFEIEAAYIDKAALTGLNIENLPPAQWPKPRKRWTHTIKAPLKVLPSGP